MPFFVCLNLIFSVFKGDRWWWLQNTKCLDQFAIQYEDDGGLQLEVFTHAKNGDPILVQQRTVFSLKKFFRNSKNTSKILFQI